MFSHFLPPGPWESRGNRVVTGSGQTIATVFFPRYAAQIAEVIASYPDMKAEIDELKAQIAELQSRLEPVEEFDE